jgi:hypothetical protein
MFITIVLGVLIFVGAVISVLMFRNHWVYNKRMDLLHSNYAEYLKLLSYDKMLYKFWVWDIKKLKRKEFKGDKLYGNI